MIFRLSIDIVGRCRAIPLEIHIHFARSSPDYRFISIRAQIPEPQLLPCLSQETSVLFQTQKQKIDPKIILANTMLQLSGAELEQAIERELAENPALEMEDEDPCEKCDLSPFGCSSCQYNRHATQNAEPMDISSFTEVDYSTGLAWDPDDETDVISNIEAGVSLHDHLREQLRSVASERIYEIGDYLINYINESGYLDCDLLEISLELSASDEELVEAVRSIQSLDPSGVGARDLQECLLIQLRNLAEEGQGDAVAEKMVSQFWHDVVSRKLSRIAHHLRLKPARIEKAFEFMRSRLNPYPSAGFRVPWDSKPTGSNTAVRPDVIVRRTPNGYEIEVVSNDHLALSINPRYREIYSQIARKKKSRRSTQEEKHISESVQRACMFIKQLYQRRRTLRNITKAVVEYQHGYLSTNSKVFLRPLTRTKIAESLGIHTSTVSRATANKYVLLPSQDLVAFDFFFHSGQLAINMVTQMILNEEPSRPLSDQQIADALTERGYPISRRTVAKYRNAEKILSSSHRRGQEK